MASSTSYNGWPASSDPAAINTDRSFDIAGVTFPGGVKAGDVSTVLGYVLHAIDTRVTPLVPGWCWGWDYRPNVNNPSQTSNHGSSTAADVNAPDNPNGGRRYGSFNTQQVAEIRRILAEVDNVIRWGADYTGTPDPMHFEVNTDAATLARVAARLRSQEEVDMELTPANLNDIATAVVRQLMGTAVLQFGDPANPGVPVAVSYQNYLPRVGNWAAIAADNTNKMR